MANAIATIKLMPESPDVDLKKIEHEALKIIHKFAGRGETKTEIKPVAFGLNSVNISFVMDENLGSPDKIEEELSAIPDVNSVETTDVRRTIG